MQIRVGYELIYDCPQPTPMVLMLNIHHTRANDIVVPDRMTTDPRVPMTSYRDGFGNWCTRIVAPAGRLRLTANALLNDTGEPDPIAVSRAPARGGGSSRGVARVPPRQPILRDRSADRHRVGPVRQRADRRAAASRPSATTCISHITFSYQNARSTRTAWEAFDERKGVCRDYAHLAIAFCRCMNIPARYCTGYLGDIGMPPPYGPMDFAAWFEAYIGGRWHTFDPRNNVPRIGRVLMARGRDATDVAISTTFGPNTLAGFKVWTDEVSEPSDAAFAVVRDHMRLLTVRHVTVYRYSEPVRLGEHRMMFRPRESHDLRLVSTKLDIRRSPSDLRWLHDVFDNSVAIATFDEAASELRFDSTVTLEHIETALPDYALEMRRARYPFRYSDDERPDLVSALARHYPARRPRSAGRRAS